MKDRFSDKATVKNEAQGNHVKNLKNRMRVGENKGGKECGECGAHYAQEEGDCPMC